MNKAIGLANGKFMLFMNSGDVFFDRSSLSKLIERVEATNSSAVFGGWVRQSPGGSKESRQPKLRYGLLTHKAALSARSLHRDLRTHAWGTGLTTVGTERERRRERVS